MASIAAGCSGATPDRTDDGTGESTENLGTKGSQNGHGHGGKSTPVKPLDGRVVAVGIPGASAISAVGTFLPGGPVHDKPELAAFTQKGRVLDPTRILVGSTSNFGAAKANPKEAEGAILSLDPAGAKPLEVPSRFAKAGGQASAVNGAVQMYSSQSEQFRNGFYTPSAVTANEVGVSNPLGLSINNGFGRVWPANAPYGLRGPGTSSIDDPDGRPLKGAPNQVTGGVYLGDLTGRLPSQVIPGALSHGAVGTAFLGASPDGSTRAVFAVVVADGSIVQEHTGKGLDGLAPVGTVDPLIASSGHGHGHAHPFASDDDDHDADHDDGARLEGHHGGKGSCHHDGDHDHDGPGEDAVTPRVGAVVNHKPTITLFVSQPYDGSIKAVSLGITGAAGSQVYTANGTTVLRSSALDFPVDLAPVAIDKNDPIWSANTTLVEGSDFYVCNRGNNTLVRMRQDGTVVAIRSVRAGGHGLGDARLNGVATSPDGTKIWVTYTGRLPASKGGANGADGGVLELPAF